MQYTWDLNPTALSFLGLEIRWYGLAYLLGYFLAIYLGWHIWKRFQKNEPTIEKADFDSFVFSTFIVGVLSARIGLFIFYYPETLLTDPLQVFRVWQGGMSIHGGLIGATLWGLWQCRRKNWPILKISDTFMLPLALGLFVGRITNFINGELYGRATDQSWGVIFPHIDALLRHPSQLYEASKNLLIAAIIYYLLKKNLHRRPGILTATMLIGYGVFRFLIEFVREPSGYIGLLTTGQALCVVMITIGAGIIGKILVNSKQS